MKLTFIKTGINGEGIARHNGKLVFCNGVFPEETAIVITIQEEKNYIRAKLDTLLQTAAFRRPNPCPYAQACGGCALLAMQDARQIFQKEELLQEALWKYGHIKSSTIRKMHPSVQTLHYRNQLKLPVHEKDGLLTGMYRLGTNHFIPIDECLIHEEELELIRKRVLQILNHFHMHAYNPHTHRGLRSIVIRTIQHHTQLTFITGNDNIENPLLMALASIPHLTTIAQSINTERKTVHFFGSKPRILYGSKTIPLRIDDCIFQLSPASFFQLNTLQAVNLYHMAIAKIDPCDTLVEAYCGIGVMSILARHKAKTIIGIENVADAVHNAQNNAKENHCADHVRFICEDAAQGLQNILQACAVDILLVDPPRSGMDERMLQTILASSIKKIIYISCNPATLGRNLNELKHAYEIRTIIPFDMFPNTPHVESLTILTKRGTSDRIKKQKKLQAV